LPERVLNIHSAVFDVRSAGVAECQGAPAMTAYRGGHSAMGTPARVLVMALVVLAALAWTAPVRAATTHHPQGQYAVFSGCPLNAPMLDSCIFAHTISGELRIGAMVVPISRTFMSLDGGFQGAEGTFIPPEEGGLVLQPTPIPVPGGLATVLEPGALPSSLRAIFGGLTNAGLAGLTAAVEIAGPSSDTQVSTENALQRKGSVLVESLKLKLTNPLLGEHCYIGTNSDPLHMIFTEGMTSPPPPNRPIEGALGIAVEVPFDLPGVEPGEGSFFRIFDNSLVDDSFAVPAASGCGGSLAPTIDRAIDAKMRLPSPAGSNTMILNTTLELVTASLVIESE
jgi:hypothetical protein